MKLDNNYKKKEQFKKSKKTKKYVELTTNKKKNNSSDEENDNINDDSESEEIDYNEYKKLLLKLFPSKYLKNKLSKEKSAVSMCESSDEDWNTEDDDNNVNVNNNKKVNRRITNNKIVTVEKNDNGNDNKNNSTENNDESEDYDDYDDDDDDDDSEDEENEHDEKQKFNIIFTIGGNKNTTDFSCDENTLSYDDEDYDEDEYADEDNDEDDDEDVSVSSVSTCDTENDSEFNSHQKHSSNNSNNSSNSITNNAIPDDVYNVLKELLNKKPNNTSLQKCIKLYNKDIQKQGQKKNQKEKKQKAKNARIFKKYLKDKNTMNDLNFFEGLDIEHQKKIIKELKDIYNIIHIEKPYRMTLLESDIPIIFKSAAMKKINSLRYMEPGSGEFYKIKNWVDTFMRIPFGKYQTLPINITDGVDKCHEFIEKSQKILNDAVYGLNDAKMQIMQMLGLLITNPTAIGSAIAIHGPPGTGKTSLVKEGISKVLNRPFAFIALGGATDSSFLEGHSYTYEGSTWGKIVQILVDSKCMNPVIYFDELDKISDTPRGEEIIGILTHLTDTSQNTQFHDKYFSEIDFDLSKCFFIFSYNDESKVNPILKDRMYRIQTAGYNNKQKIVISNNYIIKKIQEQVLFNDNDIIIKDDTLSYIIEKFCNKEDGVRNLKRCIEIIYTKLNLYKLMKPDTNLFQEDMTLHIKFPIEITKNIVDKLIKHDNNNVPSYLSMYL